MPSIRPLPSGKWQAIVNLDRTRHSRVATTQGEAVQWARKLEATRPSGPRPAELAARLRISIAESDASATELGVDLGGWVDVRQDDLLALLDYVDPR